MIVVADDEDCPESDQSINQSIIIDSCKQTFQIAQLGQESIQGMLVVQCQYVLPQLVDARLHVARSSHMQGVTEYLHMLWVITKIWLKIAWNAGGCGGVAAACRPMRGRRHRVPVGVGHQVVRVCREAASARLIDWYIIILELLFQICTRPVHPVAPRRAHVRVKHVDDTCLSAAWLGRRALALCIRMDH